MFSIKKLYLFYMVSFLFLTFSRTFTVLFLTEAKTGFLVANLKIVSIVLLAFCLFVLLILALSAFACEKKPLGANKPSLPTAICSFLVGGVLAAELFIRFNSSVLVLSCFKTLFGLLSVAAFVLYGLYHFGKVKFSGIYFAPFVLYLVFETVVVFTNYSTLSVISDHVFDVAVLCLFLVFFLQYTKMQSGKEVKSKRGVMTLGVLASCISLSYQFSNYICIISGAKNALHSQYAVFLTGVTLSVFVLLTLNDMCKKGSVAVEEKN